MRALFCLLLTLVVGACSAAPTTPTAYTPATPHDAHSALCLRAWQDVYPCEMPESALRACVARLEAGAPLATYVLIDGRPSCEPR